MLEAQDGVCAVCAVAPAAQVDHDHETGRVRELLCFNCNGGLGQFRDDPEVLRRAAEYVERHALADEPGADLDVETAAATACGSSRAVSAGYSRWLAMTAG